MDGWRAEWSPPWNSEKGARSSWMAAAGTGIRLWVRPSQLTLRQRRSCFNTDNIKGENKENKNKILERILNIFFWPQKRKEQKQQLKSKCPSHHVQSAAPREKSIQRNRDTGLKEHRAREDLVQNRLPLLRHNLVTNNGGPKASVGGEVFPNLWGSLDEESWKWLQTELTGHFSFVKQESKGSL